VSTGQETGSPHYYVPIYVNTTVTTIKNMILTPNGVIGDPANETSWDSTLYNPLFPDYLTAIQTYDTEYIRNNQNEKIGFRLPDHTTETGSIINVTVNGSFQMKGLTSKCIIYLWNETIDEGHESAEFTPPTVWTFYEMIFLEYKDNNESRPWTWQDIDNLEVLITKAYGLTYHVLSCNSLYVRVSYTEETEELLPVLIPVQETIMNIKTYMNSTNLSSTIKTDISNKLGYAIKFFNEYKFNQAMKTLNDLIKDLLQKKKITSYDKIIINKIVTDILYIVNNIKIQ
jgi:hypothetical protein